MQQSSIWQGSLFLAGGDDLSSAADLAIKDVWIYDESTGYSTFRSRARFESSLVSLDCMYPYVIVTLPP